MRAQSSNGNGEEPEILALRALGWVLSDNMRAARLLALTGMDPNQLRAHASDTAVLAATIDFLAAHEPDLMACAKALDVSPEHLVRTARALQS